MTAPRPAQGRAESGDAAGAAQSGDDLQDGPRSDDRLIVALDVATLTGLALAERSAPAATFYKIGLGMLTGGDSALALAQAGTHGKRIFST